MDGLGNQNWQPVPAATSSSSPTPIFRGQLVATDETKLDAQGDKIQSKYLKTNLKHPLVRADHLIEANKEVAVRVVVEDQLVAELFAGYHKSDLEALVAKNNAHVARQLTEVIPSADGDSLSDSSEPSKKAGATPPEVYLISMGPQGKPSLATSLTPQFLAQREQLKKALQAIAKIVPYVITPSSGGSHSVRPSAPAGKSN